MKFNHVILICLIILIVMPYSAMGEENLYYAILKSGAYFPTGDLEDKGLDTGVIAEIAYGRQFNENFAAELGVGYYYTDDGGTVIRIAPFTVTAKGILPYKTAELFAGVGVGGYLVDSDSSEFDDDDFVFGGHIVTGVNYNITSLVFIGVEGKYFITDVAEFNGDGSDKLSTDLNGINVTGNLGFRF